MFQSHSLLFIDSKCVRKNDPKMFLFDSPRSSQNNAGHKVFHIKIIKSPRVTDIDHFCTIGALTNKKFYITRKSLNIEGDNLSDSSMNIQTQHLSKFNIRRIQHKKIFTIETVPRNCV